MSTLLMVIASAFIVCGLLVAVVCLQALPDDSERLALLLRIGAGLDEAQAAGVLGVELDAYCQWLALEGLQAFVHTTHAAATATRQYQAGDVL